MPAATATPIPNRVLAALDHLAAQMRADAAAINDLRGELRMLLTAIRLARPDIDAGRPRRQGGDAYRIGRPPGAAHRRYGRKQGRRLRRRVDDNIEEAARPQLAVVPPPEEPELPIPFAFYRAAAGHRRRAGRSTTSTRRQRRDHAGGQRVGRLLPAVKVAATLEAGPANKPAAPKTETPPADPLQPLAAIMVLSEEERIALFS